MLHHDMQNLMRAHKPPRGGPVVFYLFFTDDCLLVAKITVKEVGYLKAIVEA